MRDELELNLARAKSNEERQALLDENSEKEQQFLSNLYQTLSTPAVATKKPKAMITAAKNVLPKNRVRMHRRRQHARRQSSREYGPNNNYHRRHEEIKEFEKTREELEREELEREEEAVEDFEEDDEDEDEEDDDDDFENLSEDENEKNVNSHKIMIDNDKLFEPLSPKDGKDNDMNEVSSNEFQERPFISSLNKMLPRFHKDHGVESMNKINMWPHHRPKTVETNTRNSKDMQIATLGTVIGVLICSLLVLGCMCYVAMKKINQISWKSTKASHTLLKPRALWHLHRMLYEHNRFAHDDSDTELENSLVPSTLSSSSSMALASSSEASSLSANDEFMDDPLTIKDDERGPIINAHVHKHHFHHHHQHHLSSSRRFYH